MLVPATTLHADARALQLLLSLYARHCYSHHTHRRRHWHHHLYSTRDFLQRYLLVHEHGVREEGEGERVEWKGTQQQLPAVDGRAAALAAWSKGAGWKAEVLVQRSKEAALLQPHSIGAKFSHMIALVEIAHRVEDADRLGAEIEEMLSSTLGVYPPLRWGAALLPLEFALVWSRAKALQRQYLAAVTGLMAGLKHEVGFRV